MIPEKIKAVIVTEITKKIINNTIQQIEPPAVKHAKLLQIPA